jgi:hypothetical protein
MKKTYKQRAAASRRDFIFGRPESGFARKLRKALGGELPDALRTDPGARVLEATQTNLNSGRSVYFEMDDGAVKMCRRVRARGKIRCHRVMKTRG